MWDFVVKYWVEFLFGLIIAGGGAFLKYTFNLAKKERIREQKEANAELKKDLEKGFESMLQKSEAGDAELQKEIDVMGEQLDTLRKGVLSIQRKDFIGTCQMFLDENHIITLDEFEQITEDHEVYNALGGNHRGDNLYRLVEEKARNTLTNH